MLLIVFLGVDGCFCFLFLAFFAILMGIAILLEGLDVQGKEYIWILFAFGAVGSVATVIVIYMQPQSQVACTFKVPLLPIVSSLSTCVNIILMLKLSVNTWIRFAVWIVIGKSCINHKNSES